MLESREHSTKATRTRHSDPPPTTIDKSTLAFYFLWLIVDDDLAERPTFTPHRIHISPDSTSSPQSPSRVLPPKKGNSRNKKTPTTQPIQYLENYLDIPSMTSVTLVYRRKHDPRPKRSRNAPHIPFYGRRITPGKRISLDALDRLWELHYRLERLRKAGLPTTKIKSPGKLRQPSDGTRNVDATRGSQNEGVRQGMSGSRKEQEGERAARGSKGRRQFDGQEEEHNDQDSLPSKKHSARSKHRKSGNVKVVRRNSGSELVRGKGLANRITGRRSPEL